MVNTTISAAPSTADQARAPADLSRSTRCSRRASHRNNPPAGSPTTRCRLGHTMASGKRTEANLDRRAGAAYAEALTARQFTSSMAKRPYDLRHAAVSTWLNAGVSRPGRGVGWPQCGGAAADQRQVHRRPGWRRPAANRRCAWGRTGHGWRLKFWQGSGRNGDLQLHGSHFSGSMNKQAPDQT